MISEFISTSQQRKLSIINAILVEKNISIENLISNHFPDYSERKILLDISSINHETDELFNANIITISKSKILSIDSSHTSLYEQIFSYYVDNSLAFKTCFILIIGQAITISHICKQLNISVSHMYKVLAQINIIIAPYNIRFSTDTNQLISLQGPEFNIRLFMFYFLSSTFPNDHWDKQIDKKFVSISLIHRLFNRNLTANSYHQLKILLFIITRRFQNHAYISHKGPSNSVPLDVFNLFDANILKDILLINDNNPNFNHELELLNFLIHLFIPDLVSQESIYQIGKYMATTSETRIYHVPLDILRSWEIENNIVFTNNQMYELLYFLSIGYLSEFYIPLDFWNVWKRRSEFFKNFIKYEHTNGGKAAREFIVNNFSSAFKSNHSFSTLIPYLSHILVYALLLVQKKPVTICFSFIKEYTGLEFLKQKISQIYQSDIIKFVAEDRDADVIIVDDFRNSNKTEKMVLCSDFFSDDSLSRVFSIINQKILQKNKPSGL